VTESHRWLQAALAPGTWVAYKKCIERFLSFRAQFQLGAYWPASEVHVIAFISFLSIEGWAPSSINLHSSAISFVHKINGWVDPTDSFLVKKLKEGCRRQNRHVDSRLPISPEILFNLVRILPSICSSVFEAGLFKAAFVLAFFGF